MTRLAFAGKLGKLGSPPSAFCSVPAKIVLGKRLAKAITPRPRADLAKNWRRVTKNGSINRLGVIVHLFHTVASRFIIVWETAVIAARSTASSAGSDLRSPTEINLVARSGSCLK